MPARKKPVCKRDNLDKLADELDEELRVIRLTSLTAKRDERKQYWRDYYQAHKPQAHEKYIRRKIRLAKI